MLVGEPECLLRELVFTSQRGAKKSGIIGVQRDHHALIEIIPDWVFRGRFANPGPQIAGHADLKGNLPVSQFFDQIGILCSANGVADALRVQIERSPNGFRRTGFAGMRRQVQTMVLGIRVHTAEKFGRSLQFISADTDADHMLVLVACRQLEYFLCLLYAEVASGVENPQEGDAEIARAAAASTLEAFKNRGEILFAIEADS